MSFRVILGVVGGIRCYRWDQWRYITFRVILGVIGGIISGNTLLLG